MYSNGGAEAEGFKQENGCVVVGTTFFTTSADAQTQSTTKHRPHDLCSDVLGMWNPRMFVGGGHMEGLTSNVMKQQQQRVVGARKTKRTIKGSVSVTSKKKDLMEAYRISRPSGSKDRHSKVATARGPRDRRMRLSVETAVKFFHLQDRLGFDQPSKAVEWLIDRCTSAIEELPRLTSSEFISFSAPLNGIGTTGDQLMMNCERKRGRNNYPEQKTKAKERSDQEGSKHRRRCHQQAAKISSEMEAMKLGQDVLHMNSHVVGGIRTLESSHRASYLNCAQYSPELGFQSYPSSSSVQSADSTTFSGPFPRVMPSISIDPQSTMSEF